MFSQAFLSEEFSKLLEATRSVECEARVTRARSARDDVFAAAVHIGGRQVGFLAKDDAAALRSWSKTARKDLVVLCAARVTKTERGVTSPFYNVELDLPWPAAYRRRASLDEVVAQCAASHHRVMPL
jgi:hypothetical protein